MPRVAHVISTPEGIGGAEPILVALLREGHDQGWEQVVLNPFGLEGSDSELAKACRVVAPGVEFESRACTHIRHLPGLRRWLRGRLQAHSPDVIHGHLFHAAALLGSLSSRTGADRGPTTVLTHHHGEHNVAEHRWTRAIIDRWAGRRFARVVAISESVRDFLTRTYHYPPEMIELIRNGWEGEPLARQPSGPPTIVCVARLREQKGHRDLFQAFKMVLQDNPTTTLRLIGDGPLDAELRMLAQDLGIASSVEFHGSVHDVWPHLAAAELFVLASHYEPLGIAVMEAMAAGVPVVATEIGGIPEVAGQCGQLVPARDPDQLAIAIQFALDNPEWRAQASHCGREVASGMRMKRMSVEYIALYGRLLQGA